jgi:putative flippase GtrA
VANTVIDVALFWLLQAPLGILSANFVSTSAGMIFSFLVNGRHTFGASRVTLRQAVTFLATNAVTMWLLQPLVIGVAHGVLGAPLMPAKVLALGGSVVANFLLYRYLVWPRSSRPGGTSGLSPDGGSSESRSGRSRETAEHIRDTPGATSMSSAVSSNSTHGEPWVSTGSTDGGSQAFDAARRSRRSSGGRAKMSDSSALWTASASGKPWSDR